MAIKNFSELLGDPSIGSAHAAPIEPRPEPVPRPIFCPVISVDDHALEPPNLFVDRLPRRFLDHAPRFVEPEDNWPHWLIDGERVNMSGGNATSGLMPKDWFRFALRYSELRDAVWKPDVRIRDMDLNGVWASLNFPSMVFNFTATRLWKMSDPELGLACIRAYNDWILEEWCAAAPDRFIPCQVPWHPDPVKAAAEIRQNASRGFRAVTFSENPELLGLPSIHTGHWDPFFAACEETGTVINLHVGSSGHVHMPSSDSPVPLSVVLFPLNAIEAIVDWIYSRIPIRFPKLKIVLSEGGASWVPMIVERLNRAQRSLEAQTYWTTNDPHPVDVLRNSFWFASIEDPSAFRILDVVGEDRMMVETDYPHPDSTWPDSQALFAQQMEALPEATVRRICFGNAAELYTHPEPPQSMIDASTFWSTSQSGGPSSVESAARV